MDLDNEFADENLLDDFDDDDAMSPMASMLIPTVEMRDEPSRDDSMDELQQEQDDLLDILNRSAANLHQCNMCEKGFKRKSHLQRHYRLHTGEQPYECTQCNMRFARSERRNQHMMRVHQQSTSAAEQPTTPTSVSNGSDETKRSERLRQMYRCGICNVKFERAVQLRDHMVTHSLQHLSDSSTKSKKVYRCDSCPMEFTRYDHLIRHQTVHSGAKSYQCRFCEKFFTRSDNRTKHEKSCKAIQSSQNIRGLVHVNDAQIIQNNSLSDADPLAIINVSSIMEHEFSELDGDDSEMFDGIDPFDDESQENGVAEEFNHSIEATRKSQSEADEDLFRLGGIRRRIERPRLTQEEIDTLTCGTCNKKLTQKYHLVRHKLIHMGDQKPYKCTICDRTFARRENLKHHLMVHKRQSARRVNHNTSFEVPATPAPMSTTPLLIHPSQRVKRHFELRKFETTREKLLLEFKLYAIKYRQDTSNAIYFHDFYEKCFNYMGNMFLKNIDSLSADTFSEKPTAAAPSPSEKDAPLDESLPDEDADEAIEQKPDIDPDTAEDGEFNGRKSKCTMCAAVFPSVSHLKRHIVQHTGEKPHHCDLCGRDFTRSEHKKRHMMAVHMNQQMYECEICCKRFNRSDHMVSHFRVHHVGIKPYTCKFLCGERFDTFKDKLAHSRFCNYVPPNPDSPDKEGDVSDSESQELYHTPGDAVAQFQNHFIKTEKEDDYGDNPAF